MSLKQLPKAELISILKDKDVVVLHLEESSKQEAKGFAMDLPLQNALLAARCRLCIGERYEVPAPDNPAGKVLRFRGQPIAKSAGGTEVACRACKHVRRALQDVGNQDVYI